MERAELDRVLDGVLRDRHLLQHPFYRRWEAGSLQMSELASYAGQYRYFEQALPGILEQVAVRLYDEPARDLVQANLDDERGRPRAHLVLFDEFAEAVGARPDDPCEPATEALVSLYRDSSGSDPVRALAALGAYEVQAPAIALSKADGLREHYGLGVGQTQFWDVHGELDMDHSSWMLGALARLSTDGGTVRRAASEAAEAWWSFLDEREEATPEVAACSS